MKKALIAASIAAGLAGVANAANTTTLYGAIAYDVQYSHNGTTYSSTKNNYKNQWDLNRNAMRIGVKGEEDLNNGLTAFYNLLVNVGQTDGASSTREAYVGLKGDFGTLTLGKQNSLYKIMTNGNDIFENAFFDDSMHYEALTGGSRPAKVISYVSPSMGGLTLAAAGILDGAHEVNGNGTSNNFNAAQLGAKYEYNGLTVSAAYSWASENNSKSAVSPIGYNKDGKAIYANDPTAAGYQSTTGGSINDKKQYNVIGGQINYANDQFYAGVGAEHAFGIGNKYNVAGAYYYGPNTFQAGFGLSDSDDMNKGDKLYTYALGYMYNFSSDTYTYVNAEYQHAAGHNHFYDNRTSGTLGDSKDYVANNGYLVRVGLRHNF